MEILINELSLNGQFNSIENFIEIGLKSFVKILNDIDFRYNTLYKKYDFYQSMITSSHKIHDTLIGNISRQYDEIRKFKSQLTKLLDNPYWECNPKHFANCIYLYNGNNVCGFSLAEACERDKIVISFIHTNFSNTKLQVYKNEKVIHVDNLFHKEHYIEVAYHRGLIDKCEYFKRKIDLGLIKLLDNECRFIKTTKIYKSKKNSKGVSIYQEKNTNYYWYFDYLHQNHYEVFDEIGRHIGEADIHGVIDFTKKVNGRTIEL
jgi:hypothetical protein